MQQIRDRTQLIRKFFYEANTLFYHFRSTGREFSIFGHQGSQVHLQGSQYLTGAVVQFSSDAASLLVLRLQQLARKCVQGVFRSLALSNVTDGTGHDKTVLSLHRTQADFDRNLVAIFVKTVEFQCGAHGAHTRFEKETLSMPQMCATEAFRHQHLNLAVQQLFSSIAE